MNQNSSLSSSHKTWQEYTEPEALGLGPSPAFETCSLCLRPGLGWLRLFHPAKFTW